MNNLQTFIDKYNLNIKSYQEFKNIRVIDTDKGKYVLKNINKNDNNLYNYLNNKNFDYILEREKIDNYEVYPYVNELKIPTEEKAIDLVYILSILHNKTTYYQEVSLDSIKETYEELTSKIDYLNYYYHDLQDVIEQKTYMSPSEYLLIRNISLFYQALNYSKSNLNNWYDLKKTQKKERVVLLHNKPCLEHILIGSNKKLISWDNYRRDIPIYDFLYFYKKDYLDLEMSALFDMYMSKFKFTEDEYLLFLSILTIPEKIEFSNDNYLNTVNTFKVVKYVQKTGEFASKENKKTEKENEDDFKE